VPDTVTYHRSPETGDVNNGITIVAADPLETGNRTKYDCHVGSTLVTLPFAGPDATGLTNEALLAVVYHRLESFQKGPHACDENVRAMGHVHAAIHGLHNRQRRLLAEKEMGEKKSQADSRVRLEGESLVIGSTGFDLGVLKQWKAWSQVEAACKALNPPVTAEEIATIEREAGATNPNGLAELKSALASSRRA